MKTGKDYAWNIEVVGGNDLGDIPGFQMALQVVNGQSFMYISSMYDKGFHVLDVTDVKNIKRKFLVSNSDKPYTVTPKIQLADGNLILGLAQLPYMISRHTRPDVTPDELNNREMWDSGFELWDVKTDPWNPKYISTWNGGGHKGSHRNFYNGGRYVHMTCSAEGFTNFLYRIVDISDPLNSTEVGRYFHPAQENGSEAQKKWATEIPDLHMPYIKGNTAYLAMSGYGMVTVDITNVTNPRKIGEFLTWPRYSFICHTAMPLTGDSNAVILSTEFGWKYYMWKNQNERRSGLKALIDISVPDKPCVLAHLPYYRVPEDAPWKNYVEKPGPDGPHNWHQPSDNPDYEDRPDRLYHTSFNAGLRVYDVSDPVNPTEIAYYIPGDPDRAITGSQMRGPDCIASLEDVLVDKRGYIYSVDSNGGLVILRCTR